MTRAAVLIGVNRTGGLPELHDAVAGAKLMKDWALAQGMPEDQVRLLTDEQGPVEVSEIRKAVRSLVDSGTIEQLIVYFAGHGVNIRYGEYWLLSDAPIDTSAAVNVAGSVELARRCGIPHVVFISDACRTAAEGIQAQGITGSEIFPNDPVGGPEQSVDIFFGTTLGRPALEIRNPVESSAAFKAVYTRALLDAISGKVPAALRPAAPSVRRAFWVQPRPLKACLLTELPQRVAGLGVHATVSQVPDARITSDDGAWLAAFDEVAVPAASSTRSASTSPSAPAFESVSGAQSPLARAEARLDALLLGGNRAAPASGASDRRDPDRTSAVGAVSDRTAARTHGASSSGPRFEAVGAGDTGAPSVSTRFDTQCGFELRGARLAECVSPDLDLELIQGEISRVRVSIDVPAANVLLLLDDGSGFVLPAIRGFVTALTVVDGELADVAYEPAEGTWRWNDFVSHAAELRSLRAAVADAARDGVFRLEGDRAPAMAARMQYAKEVDPALALYAAYAYHDLQMTDRIHQMDAAMATGLGISFFDLGLLGGSFRNGGPGRAARRFPPLPMLSQGWALLSAFGAFLPAGLGDIQRDLLPSLWTHFNPAGAARIREALLTRRFE